MANIILSEKYTGSQIKIMHAVNNGPIKASSVEQTRGNFDTFRAAHIPYARTHDASFFSGYGGEHTVDVHAIFPDFNANPYDARSYDFTLTDEYLSVIAEAGTGIFYRLGSKIEHWSKKYGTIVPADFHKWAVICEHIIRHYNEGWADGYHFGIEYWEIWNEPDGVKPNGDQPNWSGTPEEFYELYETAAVHLKSRFPHLKIGGPAVSYLGNTAWVDGFFRMLTKDGKHVPLDFFTWHVYTRDPAVLLTSAETARKLLDDSGYAGTESICNEWNYLENFTDKFVDSILHIIGIRGAAFSAAAMIGCQHAPLDMLMYYDARPCVFNGMFDFYTYRPLKGYYPFVMFSKLYELENETESTSDDPDIRVLSAGKDGRQAAMIVYYSPDNTKAEEKTVSVVCGNVSSCTVRLLDAEHTVTEMQPQIMDGCLSFSLKPNSVVFLEKDLS